jgi:hydrogenase maturation protein HypF
MSELHGAKLHITGIVQGVGFRPFIYGLAFRFGLTGWVRNTSAGVDIEVDGTSENL